MDSTQFLTCLKRFIKSSDDPTSTSLKNEQSQVPIAAFSSGSDIKRFYECTVGKKAFDKTSNLNEPKLKRSLTGEKFKSKTKVSKVPFNVNSFMKAVENADFKEVDRILDGNQDSVNSKDPFGWTPLMSACCSGNKSMVEFLLKYKPDLSLCDKRGNSCRDLAQAKGHKHIINILNQYIHNSKTPETVKLSSESKDSITTFYCAECKQSVENTSYKRHISSTVHNFNVASRRKMPTLYGIPESNKGFQILVKSGWNKEEGLGPSGDGHKFPPKTILKQDRTGLGAKKYKPRVTHNLEDARKEATPRNTFKRQLRSNKRNEQRHERNLRVMLS